MLGGVSDSATPLHGTLSPAATPIPRVPAFRSHTCAPHLSLITSPSPLAHLWNLLPASSPGPVCNIAPSQVCFPTCAPAINDTYGHLAFNTSFFLFIIFFSSICLLLMTLLNCTSCFLHLQFPIYHIFFFCLSAIMTPSISYLSDYFHYLFSINDTFPRYTLLSTPISC